MKFPKKILIGILGVAATVGITCSIAIPITKNETAKKLESNASHVHETGDWLIVENPTCT